MTAALHELRHCFAAGLALVEIGLDRAAYEAIRCIVAVDGQEGEFALYPEGLHDHHRESAMALAAFGPLAATPGAWKALLAPGDPLSRMTKAISKAGLSDDDLRWIDRWGGPMTTPAIIVRAVEYLETGLGLAALMKLAGVVKADAMHDLEDPIRLSAILPYTQALKGLARARADLHGRNVA